MLYSINYDLRQPGRDYDDLFRAIKNCGSAWYHCLESTWLVDTSLSADQIWDQIARHVDGNDFVLVVGITRDHQGWMPKDVWEWINERQNSTV